MLLPGIVHESIGKQKSFDLAVSELKLLCQAANDEGILLNIEPCEPSIVQHPADAFRTISSRSFGALKMRHAPYADIKGGSSWSRSRVLVANEALYALHQCLEDALGYLNVI